MLTPALWIVLALLSISLLINYVDRSSISTAAPLIQAEFALSAKQLGNVFAAFSYTYAVFLILAGWLADRYNVNWVLAIGFAIWSISTLLTGFADGMGTFFVLRLFLGIGESVAYPCYSRIVVRQFPEQNRGVANSIISIGMPGGMAVGTFAGAILMSRFGWRPFFIFLGAGTMLWLVPWFLNMPKEKVTEQSVIQKSPSVGKILEQRSFWGTCAGLFALNFVLYFMINWLPLYVVRERGFAMDRVATVGFVYLIGAVLSPLFGWLSDYMIMAGLTASQSRKSIMAGGLAIASLSLLACVTVQKHEVAMMLMMFAGVGFGLSNSQTFAITQTLAGPDASGRWTGFQNFMGNLAGISGPLVVGALIDFTGHFFWPFALTTIVGLVGVVIWIFIVGPLEQIHWD